MQTVTWFLVFLPDTNNFQTDLFGAFIFTFVGSLFLKRFAFCTIKGWTKDILFWRGEVGWSAGCFVLSHINPFWVLRIPQSSSITGASPSDCLVSYPGHLLGEIYPSAEMQFLYSTAPAGPWGWGLTPLQRIQSAYSKPYQQNKQKEVNNVYLRHDMWHPNAHGKSLREIFKPYTGYDHEIEA